MFLRELVLPFLVFTLTSSYSPQSVRGPEISLEKTDSDYYTVRALIGSPPQELTLLVNTELAYSVVEERSCRGCGAPKRFSPANSTTFSVVETDRYDDMEWIKGRDVISLGSEKSIYLDNFTFLIMTENHDNDYRREVDGVLGLGLSDMRLNLPHQLQDHKDIEKLLYTIYFCRYAPGFLPYENAVLSFSKGNLTKYSTQKEWLYVAANTVDGMWVFNLSKPEFLRTRIGNETKDAVLSSAVNKILAPKSVINEIYSLLCAKTECQKGPTNVYWNCTKFPLKSVGGLGFTLGDSKFALESELFTKSEGENCWLTLGVNEEEDSWVLGTPFMQKYYLLFDGEDSRVGVTFAKQYTREVSWSTALAGIGVVITIVGIMAMVLIPQKGQSKEEKVD